MQAHEYLLYSGLMLADCFLLAYFSVVYRGKMNANYTAAKPLNDIDKKDETSFSK